MATYNGHPNWAQWNVALWIGNDEGLYNTALYCVRMAPNKQTAATFMLRELEKQGIEKTPDGARYTKTSVLHAMRGLE